MQNMFVNENHIYQKSHTHLQCDVILSVFELKVQAHMRKHRN